MDIDLRGLTDIGAFCMFHEIEEKSELTYVIGLRCEMRSDDGRGTGSFFYLSETFQLTKGLLFKKPVR